MTAASNYKTPTLVYRTEQSLQRKWLQLSCKGGVDRPEPHPFLQLLSSLIV